MNETKTTAVQNLINSLETHTLRKWESSATQNSITLEQWAACQIVCGNKDIQVAPGFTEVAKDTDARNAMFARIALIPEMEKGSVYIPSDRLIEALKA